MREKSPQVLHRINPKLLHYPLQFRKTTPTWTARRPQVSECTQRSIHFWKMFCPSPRFRPYLDASVHVISHLGNLKVFLVRFRLSRSSNTPRNAKLSILVSVIYKVYQRGGAKEKGKGYSDPKFMSAGCFKDPCWYHCKAWDRLQILSLLYGDTQHQSPNKSRSEMCSSRGKIRVHNYRSCRTQRLSVIVRSSLHGSGPRIAASEALCHEVWHF